MNSTELFRQLMKNPLLIALEIKKLVFVGHKPLPKAPLRIF